MIDLKFDHVSKVYRIRHEDPDDTQVGPLQRKINSLRRGKQDFYAVRDVSFEVARGEALGIIGRNGSGKSTMLKLLANITAPTTGEITVNGRLSALIEVGSGFHPELTGRENIYLNGSILGMARREITKKLDSIIDFAGVRDFIDTPVKRFSSGMYVRLGFSIAAHLDPDILLLDEVLAVGDASFQAKCLNRIKELESAGTTIVFISHDLKAVERVCDRVLLIEHGQIVASGLPRDVIQVYTSGRETTETSDQLCFYNQTPNPNTIAEVVRVEVLDSVGNLKSRLRTGDYVRFKVVWRSNSVIEDGAVGIIYSTPEHVPLMHFSTQPVSAVNVKFNPGENSIELEFKQFPLTTGEYNLEMSLTRPNIEFLYRDDHFARLKVDGGEMFQGGYILTAADGYFAAPHEWVISDANSFPSHVDLSEIGTVR